MSHTPGPWEIARSPHGRTIYEIGPCKPEEYAGAAWLSVSEEDARLIAAAPELLDALQQFVNACKKQDIKLGTITGLAEHVIAKATGQ